MHATEMPDDGDMEPYSKTLRPVPRWLEGRPTGSPPNLTVTAPQVLPFSGLTPENFERLIVRLLRLESDVLHCQLYGNRGQDQHGIDLYARVPSPADPKRAHRVVQCRNVSGMTGRDIATAVDKFIEGHWAPRSETFVIATRASSVRKDRAEAVEESAAKLSKVGVKFELWDSEELSHRLRDQRSVVRSFFGKNTAEQFCSLSSDIALQNGWLQAAFGLLATRRRRLLACAMAIGLLVVVMFATFVFGQIRGRAATSDGLLEGSAEIVGGEQPATDDGIHVRPGFQRLIRYYLAPGERSGDDIEVVFSPVKKDGGPFGFGALIKTESLACDGVNLHWIMTEDGHVVGSGFLENFGPGMEPTIQATPMSIRESVTVRIRVAANVSGFEAGPGCHQFVLLIISPMFAATP